MNEITFIEKPWGYEKIWAHTDKYVGKLLHIKAGHRLSKQYHNIKDESVYVLKGTLDLYTSHHEVHHEIRQGESFRIEPGSVHRFGTREESVDLIEVSTPELDDVVRLEDDYNRLDAAK